VRKCRAAHAGKASYWVVATNRETEHYIAWPERESLAEAIGDVHAACKDITPASFTTLLGHDEVTFFIDRAGADSRRSQFVWAWRWDADGPPPPKTASG
jgi:hypothetical protein